MITYRSITSLKGPLAFIDRTERVAYQELVKIQDPNGKEVLGQVVALQGEVAVVQLFENSAGLQIKDAEAVFTGETKKIALSPTILGRVFNGIGKAIDGKKATETKDLHDDLMEENHKDYYTSDPLPLHYRDVSGMAINPYRRAEPHDFIQTGVTAIDVNNTVVKGQKIPIFSGSGLPDLELLAQIASQSRTNDPNDKFTVVVAGVGITQDQYTYLLNEMEKAGTLERSVMFINFASDSVVERVLTPRLALTVAEYLAFDLGFSVLTLLFDLTNYANALREISSGKEEIPGRSGYPGYLYTDLASLLERAGSIDGSVGSNTLIPILSMPGDDLTHPVPDLTGYITEGQIFLDRTLHNRGVNPPIDILRSLSRLKDKGQGKGKTREDHGEISDQIFASLAESKKQEELALVLGLDSLTETGRKYIEFGKLYQEKFLNQGRANRNIDESLDICWEILSILPREELKKLKDATIQKFGQGLIS